MTTGAVTGVTLKNQYNRLLPRHLGDRFIWEQFYLAMMEFLDINVINPTFQLRDLRDVNIATDRRIKRLTLYNMGIGLDESFLTQAETAADILKVPNYTTIGGTRVFGADGLLYSTIFDHGNKYKKIFIWHQDPGVPNNILEITHTEVERSLFVKVKLRRSGNLIPTTLREVMLALNAHAVLSKFITVETFGSSSACVSPMDDYTSLSGGLFDYNIDALLDDLPIWGDFSVTILFERFLSLIFRTRIDVVYLWAIREPPWNEFTEYDVGSRVCHNGHYYKCLIMHKNRQVTNRVYWEPDDRFYPQPGSTTIMKGGHWYPTTSVEIKADWDKIGLITRDISANGPHDVVKKVFNEYAPAYLVLQQTVVSSHIVTTFAFHSGVVGITMITAIGSTKRCNIDDA